MKKIGIAEFKEMVSARISNPNSFSGKTLVLWNSTYMQYGIAYRVIEQSCIEYNQANQTNQVWYKYIDLDFQSVNNTKVEAFCDIKDMYGYKNRGILFSTGVFNEKNEWVNFVNTQENSKGRISSDWALIACAQIIDTGIVEEDFSERCEVCELRPTVDEWAQWNSIFYNEQVIRLVKTYNNGQIQDFNYWDRAIYAIDQLLDNYDSIYQIPLKEFETYILGAIPGFPAREFWEFIQKNIE